MKPSFSIRDVLSFSWVLFKKRPFFYIVLFLIPTLLPFLFNLIAGALLSPITSAVDANPDAFWLSFLSGALSLVQQIAASILGAILSIGILKASLHIVRDETFKVQSLFTDKTLIIPYLVVSFIIGILSVLGFLLFIVPGILWVIVSSQALYLIIDKRYSFIQSLQESIRLTKGDRKQLFLFGVAVVGLLILGVIPLGLGLLIVSPVISIASAFIYIKLIQKESIQTYE